MLAFLPDKVFLDIVQDVIHTGTEALRQSETKMHRNVIDPFLMLFEMGCFDLNPKTWEASEKARQSQKSLSNKIGLFHQKIIGSIHGWKDLETGGIVDVVNHDLHVIAEVKNKYNTVKQSDLVSVYTHLHDLVMPKTQIYRGYTAYYVEIIPKKPIRYDKCFTPPDNQTGEKKPVNALIRQIDGASFYALATGRPDALAELYEALSQAIETLTPDFRFSDKETITSYLHRAYGAAQ